MDLSKVDGVCVCSFMFVLVKVILYFNVGNLYHWWCVGDGMLQRERETSVVLQCDGSDRD